MKHFANNLSLIAIAFILLCNIQQAVALPVNHYAEQSILSSGKWVKISTTERGVHRIDAATLQSWGFNDASKVSIYGQDGYMLPETFSTNDTDDLQAIPSHVENGDLYFYSTGSTKWTHASGSSYWSHTNNYYSNINYYFLTEDRNPMVMERVETTLNSASEMNTFDEYILHEQDNICLGQTGRLYLGEDLIQNNTITMHAPGIVGNKMIFYLAMGANATSTYTLTTSYNGTPLSPSITVSSSDSYTYLKEAKRYYSVDAAEEFELSFKATGSGSLNSFYLDYIRLFYTRQLALDSTQLHFRRTNANGTYYAIDINQHKSENVRVWNITDVNKPYIQSTTTQDALVVFTPQNNNFNEYVVFDANDATLPTAQWVCNVEPQNLHGIDYIPDMVIVTTRYFIKEAERIAQIHREVDNMKVLVCDQLAIFNEFSGGTPDATAIRRMMKMFYDRAQGGYGNAPRYLLLYGRSSYNNRAIAPALHNEDNLLLVTYQSESSTDQRYSYITDDYFAFLDDNSGKDLTSEAMQVSVGRMPIKNLEESQKVYKKLSTYINQQPIKNLWKNKTCFIGLNGDNNLHIRQMNTVSEQTIEENQQHMIVDKVYLSAYNSREDKAFEGAQEQIFRDLEEGAMIYDYMGHAGHISIGSNLINITHAKEMTNSIWPVFITATCDVCPFDKDENSVGEELFRNDHGGFIALYTTTRTVYTNGNEDINRELLNAFFTPGEDGKVRLGDVMRSAKTSLLYDKKGNIVSDPNKLKYCLIGDPALAIPLPTFDIRVESINGTSTNNNAKIQVAANSEVTISGWIYDTEGNIDTDFNGVICYEVYDAETQETASENISSSTGTSLLTENFSYYRYKLVTAADTVVNGKFTAKFRLPEQCLQSDTTGFISLYAYNNEKTIEAKGYNKNIYINGVEESLVDETSPTFSNIRIGDEHFSEGDVVESNTIFHCDVTDEESGLTNNEISMGKAMTLWLDGKLICNDLAGHYSPGIGFGKGSIDYPLHNLSVGSHSITVKVFDNAGNASEITITCIVEETNTHLYNIEIAEDPVTTQATISLDGVIEENMTTRFIIYDYHTGKEIWTQESSATEAVWDLETANGTAQPGEYMCHAIISIGEKRYITTAKKFIVIKQ